MTKNEALKMALEALEFMSHVDSIFANEFDFQINAIKEALAQPEQEPVSLRRGDILRCIETDELCTVWSTSTTGKTLIKWSANNFGAYTAEQIGELFWLEPEPDDLELAAEKSDNYAAFHAGYRFAVAHPLAQPEQEYYAVNAVHKGQQCYVKTKPKEPDQEPVAWVSTTELLVMRGNALGGAKDWRINLGLVKQDGDVGLYITPPQRTWVGLTDEDELDWDGGDLKSLVKAIETKLRSKND